MSTVSDFGVPGVGPAILRPAAANQFRVLLNDSQLICQQVTRCVLDMLERTITVHIKHPIGVSQEMLAEIDRLCQRDSFFEPAVFSFSIDWLDSGDVVSGSISGLASVLSHQHELNYSHKGDAEHILVLRFTQEAQ